MMATVTFLAIISMLQSAIQIAGDGGCRIKLDVDDTGMDAVMALSRMRGQLLEVTVAPCKTGQEQGNGEKRDNMATESKRQPKWTTTQRPNVD